jgi:hypothetical protein
MLVIRLGGPSVEEEDGVPEGEHPWISMEEMLSGNHFGIYRFKHSVLEVNKNRRVFLLKGSPFTSKAIAMLWSDGGTPALFNQNSDWSDYKFQLTEEQMIGAVE